ncbi:MAG TPA: LysR substrate-binding domain-containing protein [Pararhodobacter sp.]|uniref:LysR substrate-binding domain-containing protein n=1 Tax=Pararhodobacter sp. TaxID=2127056 RepID=UPI001D6ACEF8|nr:LysR substrate-binding domain-containing protein [Pararhodobacter sp.]MCB1344145.1 LysR family transcriptional regulator [Paracoccaceae bacterium]HPD92332.1 LysR substrate-binding domain-containing protein [Pararhodobacter sp.]
MTLDLPPLTWLRAFEASARTLSFTHAAAELGITQAAVSKHVKSLEHHLRQPLFLRQPRGLALTKSGAAYLPKVQDALQRLAIGTREVFGQRRNNALTIRCTVSFAVNWLAPRLRDYLDRHPGQSVRLLSSVWNDAPEAQGFDLDIQYGTGNWPGFNSHRLTWETITPLCAPNCPIQTPADLRHHRLLHVLGYHEGWGIWLKAAGATGVDSGSGLHLDTSLAAFELAAQGAGVALGRKSLAAHALASGRLIAPFDLATPIDEAFHLIVPAGGTNHPDADAFVGWLLSAVRQAANERASGLPATNWP